MKSFLVQLSLTVFSFGTVIGSASLPAHSQGFSVQMTPTPWQRGLKDFSTQSQNKAVQIGKVDTNAPATQAKDTDLPTALVLQGKIVSIDTKVYSFDLLGENNERATVNLSLATDMERDQANLQAPQLKTGDLVRLNPYQSFNVPFMRGPFTVTSTSPLTLSLVGDDPSPAEAKVPYGVNNAFGPLGTLSMRTQTSLSGLTLTLDKEKPFPHFLFYRVTYLHLADLEAGQVVDVEAVKYPNGRYEARSVVSTVAR